MTGWGQDGPLAPNAGHDIKYIALGSALAHIGRRGEAPVPLLNLVGDMGGGGLFLAFGTVSALLEAQRSGQGQVVDMAMIDGVASLMTMIYGYHAQGYWSQERGDNIFDIGPFFYDVFECADGKYVSIRLVEFPFYAKLLKELGVSLDDMLQRRDWTSWAWSKVRLADVFRARTRQQWCELLEPQPDLCFAPVLDMLEAPEHPHHRAGHVSGAGCHRPAGSRATLQADSRPDSTAAGDAGRAHDRGAVVVAGARGRGRWQAPREWHGHLRINTYVDVSQFTVYFRNG